MWQAGMWHEVFASICLTFDGQNLFQIKYAEHKAEAAFKKKNQLFSKQRVERKPRRKILLPCKCLPLIDVVANLHN